MRPMKARIKIMEILRKLSLNTLETHEGEP